MKTAEKIKNTTPIPEESWTKSTIATTRNNTPAIALPSLCFDITIAFRVEEFEVAQVGTNVTRAAFVRRHAPGAGPGNRGESYGAGRL
jgi:hypothetical protein